MKYIEYGVIENPIDSSQNKTLYARVDDDGLIRFTCTEENSDYQAYLKSLEENN